MEKNWIYLGILFVLGILLATVLSNYTSYTIFSQSKYDYYESKIKELTNRTLKCELERNNMTLELDKLRSKLEIMKSRLEELKVYKEKYENLSLEYNRLKREYEDLLREHNETLQKLEKIRSILS